MNSLERPVLQIDAKLMALFVEMTSLEPQRFCRLCNLAAVAFKFGEHGGALKGLNPFCKRTRRSGDGTQTGICG